MEKRSEPDRCTYHSKRNPKTEKEDKKETVEVDIFQFKVEVAKALEEAAKVYEEEKGNVKINIQTVGGGDDYGAALRATNLAKNQIFLM